MADTYNPIIGKEKVHRLHPFQHPTPEPGIALVLFQEGQSRLVTLLPGDQLTAIKMILGNYKTIYKVDITEHSFSFCCTLPCESDAFDFHAEAQVACSVDNPAIIVERNITDVRAVLEPLITRTMRSISRKHRVEKIETAERIITKVVKGEVYVGIKLNRFVVKLSLEENVRAHIRRLKQIEYDKEREKREAELEKQRHELEIERMRVRMEFYEPLIEKGNWQLLALQLTNHPEDVPAVIQILNQQRQAEMDWQLQALKIMLEEDALEGFQIGDAGKRILQRLVENFGLELKTKALGSTEERKALPLEEEQTTETETVKVELEDETVIEPVHKDVQDKFTEAEKSPHQEPTSHPVGQFQKKEEQLRTVPLVTSLSTSTAQPVTANNIEAQILVTVPDVEFALRVRGDDLSQIGISIGDVLLVSQQDMVKNEDIAVIILVRQHAGAKVIIRRIFFDQYQVRLVAENPDLPPIIFTRETGEGRVRIVGKVVGGIRRSEVRAAVIYL